MDTLGQQLTSGRFNDESEKSVPTRTPANNMTSPLDFIGDIQERSVKPPSSPKLKTSSATGFLEHRKRSRVSAFKQHRGATAKPAVLSFQNAAEDRGPASLRSTNTEKALDTDSSFEQKQKQQIDQENKQRLASMSKEEIEQERKELLSQLNPSLLERLLKRANLDPGRGDTGIEPVSHQEPTRIEAKADLPLSDVESGPVPIPAGRPLTAKKSVRFEDDTEPTEPIGLHPASSPPPPLPEDHEPPELHSPNTPSAPDLDPTDPSFLESLHKEYYPNLPADPSKLAWMAPIPTHGSIADQDSPYYPGKEALSASALRFDFRGGLLPPRIARAMPISRGLHHHGEAPEAAGYTVPELARLARSTFPSQRCLAFQTLGRLLYRLGRGEWGDENSEITKGLWECVETGKVLQTLQCAADAKGGHQGSRAYAEGALWLWEKGGGRKWKAA